MSKSKVTKSPVKGAPQTPTMIHKHIDNFLAKIVGETPVDDKPRNSTEFWLNEIAENLPGGGTEVVANPTLAGTEDALTGLQVGDTKYSVPQTPKLYLHSVRLRPSSGSSYDITCLIINNSNTTFTASTFKTYLANNYPSNNVSLMASGFANESATDVTDKIVVAVCDNYNSNTISACIKGQIFGITLQYVIDTVKQIL